MNNEQTTPEPPEDFGKMEPMPADYARALMDELEPSPITQAHAAPTKGDEEQVLDCIMHLEADDLLADFRDTPDVVTRAKAVIIMADDLREETITTDEEKRIRIAELCGWRILSAGEASDLGLYKPYEGQSRDKFKCLFSPSNKKLAATDSEKASFSLWASLLPDYLNDLNAMHEAEKLIIDASETPNNDVRRKEWRRQLKRLTGWVYSEHATASQRADVFLSVIDAARGSGSTSSAVSVSAEEAEEWTVEVTDDCATLWMQGVPRNFPIKRKWEAESICDAHNNEASSLRARIRQLEGERAGEGHMCSVCDWTNVSCLNLGDYGKPKWVCHGCIKRHFDSSPQPAATQPRKEG